MYKIIFLLSVLCLPFKASSQSNPLHELMLPARSATMPDWANLLYEKPINLQKIDNAYQAYYRSHEFEKNHFTRYYKRLIKTSQTLIENDGSIQEWSAEKWESKRRELEKNHPRNLERSPANQWKDIGPKTTQWLANDNARDTFCPWQANIYAFEISKSNPSILYCITETGSMFRSEDKGKSWVLKAQNYVVNSEALAIHPFNENTILVGVNSAIRKSIDGGNTFTTIFTNTNMGITDLQYSPSNPNLVLAASTTGLWKSIDAGTNWTRLINDPCLDTEFHPTLTNTIYVLKKNTSSNFYECWKSTDEAVSFQAKTNGWPKGLTNGVGRLAVSRHSPDWIYAVLLTNDRPRILLSENKAELWTIQAEGETTEFGMDNWQGFYDLDIMVNPNNAEEIIVGTGSTYKGNEKGKNFQIIGGYGGKFALHPDLQVCRSNGNDAYICTDGGITYSNDFFTNHSTYRSFGITSTDMWGFGSGWNEDIIVGGRYHNGNTVWHENFGEQTYLRMGGAESPTGYVHPINNKQVYFSDIGSYELGSSKNDKIVQKTMSLWPNESYYSMEYSEIEFHPWYYNTMFLGKDASIYKSDNNGTSFSPLFTASDPGAVIQHIEISRNNPNIMYLTVRSNSPALGKIYKTENGGLNWKETTPLPVPENRKRVMQIALGENNTIYVALRSGTNGNKVFKSDDGGLSWINWTSFELNDLNIESISAQLSSPNETVYLAASGGKVFYRNNKEASWKLYNTNLPVNHYSRQLRPFYRDNKLRSAATNGIWEIPYVENSLPKAQASVDKTSTSCSRDTFYFDDYSILEYDGQQKWEWDFPGASYVSNNKIRNPKVVYSAQGQYNVRLTVSNSLGSSTVSFEKMITIESSSCEIEEIPGTAISMNGTRKVISLPTINKLKDAKGLTVMCWIKINAKQEWFTQLISNWGSASNFGFGFAFQGYVPTTNLTFSWKDVPYQLTTSHEVPIGKWTHVALTIDSNKATVYMDGKAWSRNQKFVIDLDKTPFTIGNGVPGQGGTFNGQMDEFKIYRRVLSQNEIREQMHLITNYNDPDQVLYYQFNELNPSVVYDRIGVIHGLNGSSPLVKSTVAAGPGVSDRLSINSTQSFTFKNCKTSLEFGSGTHPNGELVLSRINHHPDTVDFSYNQLAKEYFVLRNWGTNSNFTGLKNILIDSIGISSFNSQLHFRNSANAEGASWSSFNLPGKIQNSKSDGNSSFSNNNLVNSASQWIVSGEKIVTNSISFKADEWRIYPNPATNSIIIQSESTEFQNTHYILSDKNGKIISNGIFIKNNEINIKNLTPGLYYLKLENEMSEVGIFRFVKN